MRHGNLSFGFMTNLFSSGGTEEEQEDCQDLWSPGRDYIILGSHWSRAEVSLGTESNNNRENSDFLSINLLLLLRCLHP